MYKEVSIIIDNNIEKDIRFAAPFLSPCAIAADIAGTSAVENATLNDSGNVISVSTFPLSIPYCIVACFSGILNASFRILITVIESTFLLSVDIIALIAIGNDTQIILFTMLIALSCFILLSGFFGFLLYSL